MHLDDRHFFFFENFSIRSEKFYLVIFIEIQVLRFVELEALYPSIYFIVGVDIWGSLKNRLKSVLKLMQRPIDANYQRKP